MPSKEIMAYYMVEGKPVYVFRLCFVQNAPGCAPLHARISVHFRCSVGRQLVSGYVYVAVANISVWYQVHVCPCLVLWCPASPRKAGKEIFLGPLL